MENLRSKILLALSLMAVSVGYASFAAAQEGEDARVYVIHGIRGEDLGADPALPVDIAVNGGCFLEGFTFGTIAGPVQLAEGAYDIGISPANPDEPCSEGTLIEATVPLGAGEDVTIIAHLDADGGPTASVFDNNAAGRTSLAVRHTAAAPKVDVRLLNLFPYLMFRLFGVLPDAAVEGLGNGEQTDPVPVRPGIYFVVLSPAGADAIVLGPKVLVVFPFSHYNVHAAGSIVTYDGSITSNTLSLIVQRKSGFRNWLDGRRGGGPGAGSK